MAVVISGSQMLRWFYKYTFGLFNRSEAEISFRKVYTPGYFSETDLTALDRLVARDSFITLISYNEDGEILVSHVPVLYSRNGEQVIFEGHWARGNMQSRHASQAMIVVRGPHTYISASWFPEKEEKGQVPTWNYSVAHVHGKLELVNDEAGKASIVSRLSARFEKTVGSDWEFEFDREDHRRQLKGIVGFRLVAERIDMKFKLMQNCPAPWVLAIAEQLEGRNGGQEQEIAELMRLYESRREAKNA